MAVATTIAVTATLASLCLRGLAALFGRTPIDPYKYYQLGSYCERWRWGGLVGILRVDRDAVWRHGFIVTYGNTQRPHEMQQIKRGTYFRLRITTLAPMILTGEKVDWLKNLKHPRSQKREGRYWDWIQLGQSEYRDRLIPKLRAILGEDPLAFLVKRQNTQLAYEQAVRARIENTNLTTQGYEAAMLLLAHPYAEKYKRKLSDLQKAWRETPVSIYLNSATTAQNELNRWIVSRDVVRQESITDALWFGPPVPWALELAARAYGQHGPAAVIQYTSVSRSVTRDLRILLKRISPAAFSDPVLAPFLR